MQVKEYALYKFLYSQDLSNCTTNEQVIATFERFLYSQDLSNCTTDTLTALVS